MVLSLLPVTVSAMEADPEETSVVGMLPDAAEVQAFVDALPTVEEVRAMDMDGQRTVCDQTRMAYGIYTALSEKQRSLIDGARVFEELFAFFNGQIMLLEAGDTNAGGLYITPETGWTGSASSLEIKENGDYTITSYGLQTSTQINFAANFQGTVTLKDVNIHANYAAMNIRNGANVTLMLEGDNYLYSGYSLNAGIEINDSASHLTIGSVSSGSLTAKGGSSNAAGIGGGRDSGGGNITITGGSITAIGGGRGAGIGGGGSNYSGNITITGGTVTATGGIGGGSSGTGNFSTGENGNAIIHGEIKDKSGQNNWNAVVFEGNEGTVYGDVTLDGDLTLEADETLTIPDGASLTNKGTINNNGTITGNGTVTGSGTTNGTKPSATVTAPTANTPTYNGAAQQLVTAGKATGGTLQYSSDGNTYSASIPTGTNAGDYTVWYKVEGDGNHESIDPASVTVTISKAVQALTGDITLIKSANSITVTSPVSDNGKYQYACVKVGESVGDDDWRNDAEFAGLEPGTEYTVYVRLKADNNHEPSNEVEKEVTTVKEDGSTTVKPGETAGSVTNDGNSVTVGDATVSPAPDGGIEVDKDGKVSVPGGSTVTDKEGTEYPVPSQGGTISPDGAYKDNAKPNTPGTPNTPGAPGTGGSGSSGGGSVSGGGSYTPPSYPPTVSEPDNGKASVSPGNPRRGDTVTVTPVPDEGYEIGGVVVKDLSGNELEVKDNGDGTFSFVQPTGKVTIETTFVPKETETPSPALVFSDLDPDEWYWEAVDYVLRNGLMKGYGNHVFAPCDELSRAMLAQILYNAEGRPGITGDSFFTDVPSGAWYADAITWAGANGIVDGYGNGIFGPGDDITREQLAMMLYRYARSESGGFTGDWMYQPDYADVADVSDWAYEAMCWCSMNGIVEGKGDGILDPGGKATRAETAAMLMRFLELKK